MPSVAGNAFKNGMDGIEKGRVLTAEEVQFIMALIMGWIERQIDEKGGSAV